MPSVLPALRRRLGAASLLLAAGATPATPAPPPPVPFDARVTRDTVLFRKAKPEKGDDVALPAWHVLSVTSLEPEQSWLGETAPMAQVHRHAQSTNYMLLSRLQPLAPGEVLSDEQAAALLFQKVPESGRAWCQRFTERMLLPASPAEGKGGVLIYSGSSDDACAGFLATVSGTGKGAKARAMPRRGPLETVSVHEVPGGPPLIEVVEAVKAIPGVSGSRLTLLSLERSAPREVLAVEAALNRLDKETRHSVVSTVTVSPSGSGLDIAVQRTESTVTLATGAESAPAVSVKHYRYAAGKLTLLAEPPAAAKP